MNSRRQGPSHGGGAATGNAAVGRFYDRVAGLYPLVEACTGRGRRRLIEHINGQPAGALLEIGVGPGAHLRHYRGHVVTAIDCSERMVERSRREGGAEVRLMDGEALGFPDGSFDYVALLHVLAVTRRPERMLREAHRVLRPGGTAFVLNHETPANAWRLVEAAATPLGRALCVRTWFRLRELDAVRLFRGTGPAPGGWLGWVTAHALVK